MVAATVPKRAVGFLWARRARTGMRIGRQQRSTRLVLACPMMNVGGWRDFWPDPTIESWSAGSGPKRLILGPWKMSCPTRTQTIQLQP